MWYAAISGFCFAFIHIWRYNIPKPAVAARHAGLIKLLPAANGRRERGLARRQRCIAGPDAENFRKNRSML